MQYVVSGHPYYLEKKNYRAKSGTASGSTKLLSSIAGGSLIKVSREREGKREGKRKYTRRRKRRERDK
jgi:hypothetical protein